MKARDDEADSDRAETVKRTSTSSQNGSITFNLRRDRKQELNGKVGKREE